MVDRSAHPEAVRSPDLSTDTDEACADPVEPATQLAHLYTEEVDALAAYLNQAFGSGPPDPDDIAQEAFQRLLEHEDLGGIKYLKAFLWRTARYLTITKKRSIIRRSKYDYEIEQLFFAYASPGCDPERVLEAKEQLLIIDRAIKAMPERRRKAFLLNRVDKMNFTAVGKKLGITRRAVSRHVIEAACAIQTALHAAAERND